MNSIRTSTLNPLLYLSLNKISPVLRKKTKKLSILTSQIYLCNIFFQQGIFVKEMPWADQYALNWVKHQQDLERPNLEVLRDVCYHYLCISSSKVTGRALSLCTEYPFTFSLKLISQESNEHLRGLEALNKDHGYQKLRIVKSWYLKDLRSPYFIIFVSYFLSLK